MKKIFLTLFMACALTFGANAEKTVYMMAGGTGDGSTPEAAVMDFDAAFAAIGDEGGTIVVCGPYTQTANYPASTLFKHTGTVTITSNYGGVDYRATANAAWSMTKGMRFQLGGPVVFKDIDIKQSATSNNFLLVICNFNEFTMDEGVTATGFTFNAVANSVTVLGGCQDKLDNACGKDPKINIKGGEALIVGFNRGTAKNFTEPLSSGSLKLNISGGTIHNIFAGSVAAGLEGGNVDINVSGGKFVGTIYGGKYGNNVAGGETLKMTVTGGDFAECKAIDFNKAHDTQIVTIDLANAGESEYEILMKISSVLSVDNLITNYRHPMLEFVEGEEFTASNGIVLPYRVRIPENNDVKKLPVLLFLHGNGSRGDDNLTQITSSGSCALSTYLAYDEPSIIIAPQCPLNVDGDVKMWIERDKYVGSDLYSTDDPQTPYLKAASELLDYIVETYNGDNDRLYLAGSSNGAGACWDLIVRNPGKFAAAIPVSGGREDKDFSQYGAALASTPFWTFHGDADATLPVEGTRAIVKAARDAGASEENAKYIEVPGADHNTIWKIAAQTPGIAEWMFSKSKGTNAVRSVADHDGFSIETSGDGIDINTVANADVTVYSANGCKITRTLGSGLSHVTLDVPGVYLVSVKSGSSSKVVKILR